MIRKILWGFVVAFSINAYADGARSLCQGLFADVVLTEPSFSERLTEKKDLTIASLSLDFFNVKHPLSSNKKFVDPSFQPNPYGEKSPEQVQQLRRMLEQAQPDIIVLQELITNYGSQALDPKQEYLHLTNTPSSRDGSHIGFLIRKSLDVDAQLVIPTIKSSARLHRGLPYVTLRQRNASGKIDRNSPPDVIVVGLHLSSMRGLSEAAFHKIKEEEIQAITKLIEQLQRQYPTSKIATAGDFNLDLNVRPEVILLKSHLQDTLDYARDPYNRNHRANHTFHPRGQAMEALQLGGVLINRNMLYHLIDSYVFRHTDSEGKVKTYIDKKGNSFPYPLTLEQRSKNPSDHDMIVSVFNMAQSQAVERRLVQPYLYHMRRIYTLLSKQLVKWSQEDLLAFQLDTSNAKDFIDWLETHPIKHSVEIVETRGNKIYLKATFMDLGYLLLADSANGSPRIENPQFLSFAEHFQ